MMLLCSLTPPAPRLHETIVQLECTRALVCLYVSNDDDIMIYTVFAQTDAALNYSPLSNCRRTTSSAGGNSRHNRVLAAPSMESIAHACACFVQKLKRRSGQRG